MKVKHWILVGIAALIVIAAVVALVLLLPHEEAAVEDSSFDFTELSDNGLPAGWSLSSYENQYSYEFNDGVLRLNSQIADDLRLTHQVTVEAGEKYVLSAEIMTEGAADGRGVSLSIDNYSIDQSCIYSNSLLGDNDWQSVELAFQMGEGQTQAILALRMGGYGEATSGTAYFRNVKLTKTTQSSAVFQSLTAWGDGSSDEGTTDTVSSMTDEEKKAFFSVITWAAVLAGVVLLAGVYANRKRIIDWELSNADVKWIFAALVVAGAIVRYLLCAKYQGHDTDMGCWIAWGRQIANGGLNTFYVGTWYDYPPGYMLVLGLLTKLMDLFGISAYTNLGYFCYMLPAFAGDVLCGVLIMHCAREKQLSNGLVLLLGGLVVLNPAAVFLSGAWSQIDSLLTLFLLLSFYLLNKEKRIGAGLVYAVAILFKWQALMFGPVLAVAYIVTIRSKKQLINTVLAVASALALIFIVSLPFKGTQGYFWLIERFLSAQGGYDYASVEAYNYQALVGGNWTASSQSLLGPISYKTFGVISIGIAVVLGAWMLIQKVLANRRLDLPAEENKGVVYLSAAFTMCWIFTFGHYMHERYIFPVLFMLLFAYVYCGDKRLLLASLLLTVTTFLNEMTAMYVVSDLASSVVRGGREHNGLLKFCSFLETGFCLYLGWVVLDMYRGVNKRIRAWYEHKKETDWEKDIKKAKNWLKGVVEHG